MFVFVFVGVDVIYIYYDNNDDLFTMLIGLTISSSNCNNDINCDDNQ